MSLSKRDFPQIIKGAWNENAQALNVMSLGTLVPSQYDSLALTYYASGTSTALTVSIFRTGN